MGYVERDSAEEWQAPRMPEIPRDTFALFCKMEGERQVEQAANGTFFSTVLY